MHFLIFFFLFFRSPLHHKLEGSYSNVAPPLVYSSVCNASSPHNQLALCSSQRHLMPSSKTACNVFYPPSSNSVCTNNCGSVKSTYNNLPSIPHSKSLDHYNEPTKYMDHNISRHSFDQPFDCTDRINGFHYASGIGNYHQPNCNLQNTRYPMMGTMPFPDNHYSQVGNFERGDSLIEPTVGGACCHQNSHYECVNNYNSRTKNGVDYTNCEFPPK